MLKARIDPMSYQPPKISSQVSVRVDLAYKKKAEGIRKCWEEIARVKGDLKTDDEKNPEVEVEIAHVWRELLESKVDEEVAQLTNGKGFPPLEDEKAWNELLRSVPTSYAKSKLSR